MNLCKKTVFRCIIYLLLAALLVLPTAAVVPMHEASEQYLKSPYNAQLGSVELTGDQRTDVVLVALSQLGYHEGNSDADMGGSSKGSRNFVEYNRLYGKLDNNEGNGVSYGYNWCCAFVTWCTLHAGVSPDVVKTEVSCDRLVNWLRANSTYHTSGDGYAPKTGDLIFFKTAGANRQWASHIGIVIYAEDGKVYTIEGNTGTYNVALRTYNLTDTYIVGYGVPDYDSRPAVAMDFSKQIPGTYFINVTTSDLNVRSGPGTSNGIIGAVKYADKVTVSEIQNGWGKIKIGDKDGWIFLDYAQYVPSAVYTIYYDSNGGAPVVPTQPKHDGKDAILTVAQPQKDGFAFAGWATKKDATVAEYRPGDSFSLNADTTLYAVWTVGEYTITFVNGETVLQNGTYAQGVIVGQPEAPTKEGDEVHKYVFVGWDTDGDGKVDIAADGKVTATKSMTCAAVFEEQLVEYTIRFLGLNDTVISEKVYHYGDAVELPASVPMATDGKYNYTFESWEGTIESTVTANADYRAKYTKELAKYTVKFVDGNGRTMAENEYFYGDASVAPAIIPEKAADNTYTYVFKGWSPELAVVTGDATYTAQFDSVYIDYTVTFIDGDGKEIESAKYHYGDTPKLNYEGIVTKTSDPTYDYTFKGWDKAFAPIEGDTVYSAQFEGIKRVYTVTFFNEDGTVYKTVEYNYGDTVALPVEPSKEGAMFAGWTPEVVPVEGNTNYTATFTDVQTTAPDNVSDPDDDKSSFSVGLIISLVVVVILTAGFVVFIIIRKKKMSR